MNIIQSMINEKLGEVRVIKSEDGNVMNTLFCAKDTAKALNYPNDRDAINRHCRYVVKYDIPHPQNPDKTISINFIPLCDVFSLIYGSRKEEAEEFRRWINEDVLPQLYQFGTYTMKDHIPNLPLGNPEFNQNNIDDIFMNSSETCMSNGESFNNYALVVDIVKRLVNYIQPLYGNQQQIANYIQQTNLQNQKALETINNRLDNMASNYLTEDGMIIPARIIPKEQRMN